MKFKIKSRQEVLAESSKNLTLSEVTVKWVTMVHLLVQGKKAMSPRTGYSCAYRGKDDLVCAVGFWIPDEKYSPVCEAGPVSNVVESFCIPQVRPHKMLLNRLQRIHDSSQFDESLEIAMSTFFGFEMAADSYCMPNQLDYHLRMEFVAMFADFVDGNTIDKVGSVDLKTVYGAGYGAEFEAKSPV